MTNLRMICTYCGCQSKMDDRGHCLACGAPRSASPSEPWEPPRRERWEEESVSATESMSGSYSISPSSAPNNDEDWVVGKAMPSKPPRSSLLDRVLRRPKQDTWP